MVFRQVYKSYAVTHQVGLQTEQPVVDLSQICIVYHEQCHHTLQGSVELRV
jgi:hypothetical protein